MLIRRTDLPLERDSVGRFLPWLIAFMVYLAVLALAGVMVLNATASRWNTGISGTLTIQIAPLETRGQDQSQILEKEDLRIQDTLRVLRSTPGISRADIIAGSEIMALLEPWLGSLGKAEELPLPHLIDVELGDSANLDVAALSKRLEEVVSGISIDDHRIWLDRLIRLIQTVEVLAIGVLVLIGLATIGTVIFTTRTGLAIHQEAIEVLHHIGARDSYIAGQFANRALVLGLRGGCIGLLLGIPSLLGIGYLAALMETSLLPGFSLSTLHWAALASLPLGVALIAMLTAQLTVIRNLAKMI